jgi:hypothetical protein
LSSLQNQAPHRWCWKDCRGLLLRLQSPLRSEHDPLPSGRMGYGLWLLIAMFGAVAVLAGLAGFYYGSRSAGPLLRIERLTRIGRIAPGVQAMESLPASATDGLRTYIPAIPGGRSVLAQVDVRTGAEEPSAAKRDFFRYAWRPVSRRVDATAANSSIAEVGAIVMDGARRWRQCATYGECRGSRERARAETRKYRRRRRARPQPGKLEPDLGLR